ncbi:hypothetical protein RI367_001671 [Sorochytrium milnesiophthora]
MTAGDERSFHEEQPAIVAPAQPIVVDGNDEKRPIDELPTVSDEKAASVKQARTYSTLGKAVRAFTIVVLLVYLIWAWVVSPQLIAPWAVAIIFIILKLALHYVPNSVLIAPFNRFFGVLYAPYGRLAPRVQIAVLAAVPILIGIISIAVIGTTDNGTVAERIRSFIGMFCIIYIVYRCSRKRSAVAWNTVATGILLQFVLGLLVLKTKAGRDFFTTISHLVSGFLEFALTGCAFLFTKDICVPNMFVTSVLPAVLFFCSFIQIVYYLGGMQWLVLKFAWVMVRMMNTSGSESVVAAASPFVGQGESALLVQPFIEFMTQSELHQTMTSGFATIAGSVLIAFLGMGMDPAALISSCIMSIPCSLALSKLRLPETEESLSKGKVTVPPRKEQEANVLHAAANGAAQGVTLILLIAGSLLCIISLYNMLNFIVAQLFFLLGYTIDIRTILKYLFSPFPFFMGVPFGDILKISDLLGLKMIMNEFVGFGQLQTISGRDTKNPQPSEISQRSFLICIYALCGFANFSSIGIQIGCLGAMAPTRRDDLARLALSAMLTGTMCTYCSACIAGILL